MVKMCQSNDETAEETSRNSFFYEYSNIIIIVLSFSLAEGIADALVLRSSLLLIRMKQQNTSSLKIFDRIKRKKSETFRFRHFEEFFCTHAPLIEAHFQKIMSAAEANIGDRNAIAAALLDVKR